MGPIEHVFVLMLENRSFDHFFGLSGRPDIPRPTDARFAPGARDRSSEDPPHEFDAVQQQIDSGKMDGFDPTAMLAFPASGIPVLSGLAQNYLLFDNWFSSVPGPTWPNRFFVHAASSGGLAVSPSAFTSGAAIEFPWESFHFQNGSIYDRLEGAGRSWRVYHGDVTPQVLAVQGMVPKFLDNSLFRPIYPRGDLPGDFASDLNAGNYGVDYTFIEPNYAIQLIGSFDNGDSQHPRGLVSAGEQLIKYVYETLRNSPLWATSVLLIVWDEHGGFYDHAPPSPTTPPGDTPLNAGRGGTPAPVFNFDRLGVRVPAVLVSPWVPKGTLGSTLFAGQVFDHSSVVASVRDWLQLAAPLTQRDAYAPTWSGALLAVPRASEDCPTSLPPAVAAQIASSGAPQAAPSPARVDSFVDGITLIARDLDRLVSQRTGEPTLASQPQHAALTRATVTFAAQPSAGDVQAAQRAYIEQVGAKVLRHRAGL